MNIDQEKMIVETLSSLYHLQEFEERAIDTVLNAIPHWIPVTERLPNKEEKSYWVCLEGGGQCQCRWTNDVYGLGANEWSKWGWKKVDLPQYSKVVAYMPLPEPYKGATEMVEALIEKYDLCETEINDDFLRGFVYAVAIIGEKLREETE